jgi:DMSO reductase anchor subunit
MHPAASVILFTTASGAGYGVLVLSPILLAFGILPADRWLGVALLAPALCLVTAGLLASTFHLGHPERAWRALSQWRSSWLSREGIMAIVTYGPAAAFGYAWIGLETASGGWAWTGIATATAAAATLFTTAMIYRSLKPIPAWATDWTIAGYLILGLLTGLIVITTVSSSFGFHPVRFQWLALALVVCAAIVKNAYWSRLAGTCRETEAMSGAAVGSDDGAITSIEWPHTEENYVLKEMGFRVARKHADRLRRATRNLLFVAPAIVFVVMPSLLPMPYLAWIAWPGAALVLVGVVLERWLFFAEARHVVTLYYGAS